MIVQVRNFLGVEAAEIPLPDERTPVAVVGENAQGKTSVALAIAAVLSGDANPLKLPAAKARYIRDQQDAGEVMLAADNGGQLVHWLLAETGMRFFPERPPESLAHCVGTVDFMAPRSLRDRTALWEELFLPSPEVLMQKLAARLAEGVKIDRLVEEAVSDARVEASWQAVEALYKDKRRTSERRWEDITGGGRYGVRKAKGWIPDDWMAEWSGVDLVEARERVESAEEALRHVMASQAVTRSERAAAIEARDQIPAIEAAIDSSRESLSKLEPEWREMDAESGRLRRKCEDLKQRYDRLGKAKPQLEDGTPCPACNRMLVIAGANHLVLQSDAGQLKARIDEWREQLGEIKLEHARHLGKLREMHPEVTAKKKRVEELRDKMARLRFELQAATQKAADADKDITEADHDAQVRLCQKQLEDAKAAHDGIKKKVDADAYHTSAEQFRWVETCFGPRGVRATAMEDGIQAMHDALLKVSAVSGWPKTTVDRQFHPHYNGRPVAACSTSERWRAQFSLQCAIAMMRGQSHVICDEAATLDETGWLQLTALAEHMASAHKVQCVVAATNSKSCPVPSQWQFVEMADGASQ